MNSFVILGTIALAGIVFAFIFTQGARKQLLNLQKKNVRFEKLLLQKERELAQANGILKERSKESNEVARVLVRRDLELTETNERLRELDSVKSEFVSVAAHQLRTPLTGIKWTLNALLTGEVGTLDKDQKKLVTDGLAATYRLIELINDLLDTARIEEGRFGFNFKMLSLAPILKQSIVNYAVIAKKKGIQLILKLPEAKLPLLKLDAEKIGIVLDNLIDNAIKYTIPGGKITVRATLQKEHVVLEVEDTGIGVPKEQVHRVFTKFFRAVNAQLAETSGTGLGLYVSHNIVEHHRGTLSFTSSEGKGSTFVVSLPLVNQR
ncbi:MAG: HAMP domain-containing sensor histidine kinase [bacterium]|nr:HAMP domain-containing sensor histidine kinase [bacterium]